MNAVLKIVCMALWLIAGSAYADSLKPSEAGWSYGWAHESNPMAGPPFNNKAELVVDTFGGGRYWDWGSTEFHLWFGVKHDHITRVGEAWQPAAEFLLIRKRRSR